MPVLAPSNNFLSEGVDGDADVDAEGQNGTGASVDLPAGDFTPAQVSKVDASNLLDLLDDSSPAPPSSSSTRICESD